MKTVTAGSVRLGTAAGFFIVLLAICGAGCRKETPKSPDAGTPAGSQAVAPKDAAKPPVDKILATVNGVAIKESQVKRRLGVKYKLQLDKFAAQSPQLAAQWEGKFTQLATNELVIEQLLEEQVKLAGSQVSDEQLLAEITKELAAETPPLTLEQCAKMIQDRGIDFEAWKEFYIKNMRYTRFLENKAGDSIKVTEEEARKYYDANPDEFKVPEQVRASHILISTQATDPNADPNQVKAQAKEKAEKLLKQVKEGADFATVAKENSACPSAAQGGDLGLFGRDSMVKPFEDAAFALKVGEISDLVETEFGYHIIKVTEHNDPNVVAFETAKDRIMEDLKGQKTQEAFRSYIESLRQKASITYAAGDMPPMRPPAAASKADANEVRIAPAPAAPPADANKG